jgi:hypothetical protein
VRGDHGVIEAYLGTAAADAGAAESTERHD